MYIVLANNVIKFQLELCDLLDHIGLNNYESAVSENT